MYVNFIRNQGWKMTGISIKEANKLADAIDEVYQQRDMAENILEEIYQIYYNGKMFAKTKLPQLIKEDYKKATELDDIVKRIKTYGECYLMDNIAHVNYGIKQKHQENQDIVEKLKEYYEGAKRNDYDIDKQLCIIFKAILRGKK